MYIKYLDFSFGTWEDAYLVKEESGDAYYLSPACVEWLRHLNLYSRLHEVTPRFTSLEFFQYKATNKINIYIPKDLFLFPIKNEDVKDLNYITECFLHFNTNYRKPFINHLETVVTLAKINLTNDQIKRMISFWMRDEKNTSEFDKIRLKCLMNPVLEPFAKDDLNG